MLNKDQYNQDEYNDYYKQETEGAEIKGYNEKEGGFMGKVILFFGLIALGVAGYFGFKTFNSTAENSKTVTKEKIVIKEEASKNTIEEAPKTETIEDKIIKTIETNKIAVNREKTIQKDVATHVQEEVATQVQEKLQDNQKMSTEDISKIVTLVMNKMETSETDKDDDLLNALNNSDTDTLEIKSKESKIVMTTNTNSESAIETKVEPDSSYNKVTLDENSKNEDKDLTELSEQIKKLLNMAGAKNEPREKYTKSISEIDTEANTETNDNVTSNYEDSISQEIEVRSNEMRIIVVKQGDTLNKIAKRAYGNAMAYEKIFEANPDILDRADRIYVGQKLRIPK